jgi:IS1 family transposase
VNILSKDRKIRILYALVEGSSIRSIERQTYVHRDTICRLLRATGERCQNILDEKMQGISLNQIQIDEVWGFVGKKDRHLTPQDGPEVGSQFVFVALDGDTKLIPSFVIGKRNKETALALMQDLDRKVSGHFQLTTDSFPGFSVAVVEVFGWHGIDYGQIIKKYSGSDAPLREGYGPSRFIRVRKIKVMGDPDMSRVSTSFVERQNLTLRMQCRRLTRLTNSFSKKLENFKAALALHFCWYNLMRVHQTIKMTPGMAAGISDHIWDWGEVLEL